MPGESKGLRPEADRRVEQIGELYVCGFISMSNENAAFVGWFINDRVANWNDVPEF